MARMQKVDVGIYSWGKVRDPERYKTLDQERANLLSLDLKTASDKEVRHALQAFGNGYVTRRIYSVPVTSFRASRPTSEHQPWNHLSELWAPPAKVTVRGRFNEPRKPVLYFSGDPFTALAEVRAQPNEFRVLLVLKRNPTDALYLMQVGMELVRPFEANNRALGNTRGGAKHDAALQQFLSLRGIVSHWQVQAETLTKLASDYFPPETADQSYRVSSMIGHQLMASGVASGLTFPSVANEGRGLNIAMPTNEARSQLDAVEAWLVSLGPKPRLVASPTTHPDEPIVIKRGKLDPKGVVNWGELGCWPMHELHKAIAPLQSRERIRLPRS